MSQKSPKLGHTRRSFLTAAGAAGTIALAGCLGDDDDEADVQFVLNPAEEGVEITVQYQPLFDFIEEEADVTIEPVPTSDYTATITELTRAGEDDAVFADTSPGAVVQEPDELDVVGVREAFGSELYFGQIVTLAEYDIHDLTDLQGESIATASATSVSGGFVPLFLLQEAGLDIGDATQGGDAEDFDWLPSDHFTAAEQLIQDDNIMAAGTGEFATAAHVPPEQYDEMEPQFADISPDYPADGPERDPEFRLLAISDPLPRAPIVVNAQWEDPLREEVEQALYSFTPDDIDFDPFFVAEEVGLTSLDDDILEEYAEEGEVDTEGLSDDEIEEIELLEDHELWFTGVNEADESTYDPIADLMNALDLDPTEVE